MPVIGLITANSAEVSCSVTDATVVGFAFKTATESSYTSRVAASVFGSTATATLTGLLPDTDYSVRAYASANGMEYTSTETSFRTLERQPVLTDHTSWYELPAKSSASSTVTMSFYAGKARNYTMYYDKSTFTAYWVAYPLAAGHIGSGRSDSWSSTPGIDLDDQINVWNGSYGVNYGSTIYSRGHQIPNGDRNANSTMQSQTFYATNSTPQIQNGFNGSIWSQLENGVRSIAQASADTVYVTTGAVLSRAGMQEQVTYIQPKHDSKKCPVPNYYYKVLLKVKRASNGTITDAMAVGIWMEHRVYSDTAYTNYAVSVDEVERYTGFDFFANLPDDIEAKAEKNTSWSSFSSF